MFLGEGHLARLAQKSGSVRFVKKSQILSRRRDEKRFIWKQSSDNESILYKAGEEEELQSCSLKMTTFSCELSQQEELLLAPEITAREITN